jgi:hypothetical protein
VPRPVPPYTGLLPAPEAALAGLCKAALHACLALAEHWGKDSPALTRDVQISRADGLALLTDLAGDVFTGLQAG